MIGRLLNISNINSLFLFGARGTGKSTLLRQLFVNAPATLWIDLLKESDESRFGRHPDELMKLLAANSYHRVIIDEVQKAPKLLDIVHYEMENRRTIKHCQRYWCG